MRARGQKGEKKGTGVKKARERDIEKRERESVCVCVCKRSTEGAE
jgi:hypothetical protein